MNRQNSFSSENDNFASEKSIGIKMSTSPKTIATVHEFHLHYSDFYDCGFKSLVMVAFVNGFFNPESRKILYKLVDCLEKCLIYGHIRRFAD